MSDAELEALGEELLAIPEFEWKEGMLDRSNVRVLRVYRNKKFALVAWGSEDAQVTDKYLPELNVPDLSDPATLGVLEQLACDAAGADCIDIRADIAPDTDNLTRISWVARTWNGRPLMSGEMMGRNIKACALVAAYKARQEQRSSHTPTV